MVIGTGGDRKSRSIDTTVKTLGDIGTSDDAAVVLTPATSPLCVTNCLYDEFPRLAVNSATHVGRYSSTESGIRRHFLSCSTYLLARSYSLVFERPISAFDASTGHSLTHFKYDRYQRGSL